MRTLLVFGLFLLFSACGAATDDADPASPGSADVEEAVEDAKPSVTATWRGEGEWLEFSAWEMGCAGCESTIQKRVGALEGVASVEADAESAVVKVKLADDADREALATQITTALEKPETGKVFEIIRAEP